MTAMSIWITDTDYHRLRGLLADLVRHARGMQAGAEALEEVLDCAREVDPGRMPRDAVTMHSVVQFEDVGTGRIEGVTIVFPEEADASRGRISVLSPMGLALIGLPENPPALVARFDRRRCRLRAEGLPAAAGALRVRVLDLEP